MSKTKHTPGPWHFIDGGEKLFPSVVIGGSASDEHYTIINNCRGENGGEMDELVADARLIAASPDLLAACEAAGDALCAVTWELRRKTPKEVNRAVDVIRAAIAKAKGSQ